MGMGDWYFSTNQLKGICEMIRIKGFILWVKCVLARIMEEGD
jgi:hypothetical protein